MKQILLLIALMAALPSVVHARTIRGNVFSETDSTAIEGAVCHLKSGPYVLLSGVTAAGGSFVLETSSASSATLYITMAGYAGAEIFIPAGSKSIDAGSVYLTEAKGLSEVTVTANVMTDSQGRTIVFPSSAQVKASPTSISLFSKLPLPGLDANPINRTLSVDRGTPVILINGIPSSMSDVNALQPKDIERIEYSRITPARYLDRGKSGLISITLKRRDDGGQFFAWMRDCPFTGFLDANVRTSYHQGPSQFTLSYHPSWRNYQEVYDHVRQSYIGDDFRVDLKENDRNPFHYISNPLNLKYDFSPSTRTLFSATFNANIFSNKTRSIGDTYDSELGEYSNLNLSRSRQFAPSLDLFLRHEFNPNNTIEVQTVGTLLSDKYRRDNSYSYADGTDDNYAMDVDNTRRSLITEVNYSHTFSKNTSLSGGVQNTISRSRNEYLTSDYEPILTENNNYIYARISQRISKVYLALSSGAKLFWVRNDLNKRHFVRNLTSIQANWNINSAWNVSAAFRYSPSIPSLSALTDYPQQTSPYLISNGNPDLKVAETFLYQVMPSFKYKKFTSSVIFTYYDSKNSVIKDLIYLGDRMFLSQSVNADKYRYYESMLSLSLSDIAGFGAKATVAFDRYEMGANGWRRDLNSFSGTMTLWWSHGPYTVQYWRKFPSKYMSGYYVRREENGDMLSFAFRPDKHWTLEAQWMYMFESKGTKYPAWYYSPTNPGVSERYIKNNANMLVLSVSYSADFGSIFRTGRRSLNNTDSGSSLLKM